MGGLSAGCPSRGRSTGSFLGSTLLAAGNEIHATGASISSSLRTTLVAAGDITAQGARLEAEASYWGGVYLLSGGSIDVSDATLRAHHIRVEAHDQVIAESSNLLAFDEYGSRVRVAAGGDIDLSSATVRARARIDVESYQGAVDLIMASLAITGGTTGDIEIDGESINVDEATILAPDEIDFGVDPTGTPTEIGSGTLP